MTYVKLTLPYLVFAHMGSAKWSKAKR